MMDICFGCSYYVEGVCIEPQENSHCIIDNLTVDDFRLFEEDNES